LSRPVTLYPPIGFVAFRVPPSFLPSSYSPGYPIPSFLRLLSFGFSSLVVFSSSFSATIPDSFRLFLHYIRYLLSPVGFLFRLRFSFVSYSPYTSYLLSVSALVSNLLALSVPVLSSIVSSLSSSYLSPFIPSSFGIPILLHPLLSLPCHPSSSPVSFVLRLLFPLYSIILGIGLRLPSPCPVDTSPALRRFLLIFHSVLVVWDTRFSSLVYCVPYFRMRTFYGSTHVCYPYLRSRLSSLFSPIDHLGATRSPHFLLLRSYALCVLYVFFHSSFHLVCCFGVLSRLFWFPVSFPFGVLTASTIPGSIRGLFISPPPIVVQPFEPRHHFMSIGYRSSLSLSLSLSPRFRHCLSPISSPDPRSRPFSGFMAPLWILGLTLPSPSPLFVLLSQFYPLSGATWISLIITVIPISAFLRSLSISGVFAAQPASLLLRS
jgi:hypothetical protein